MPPKDLSERAMPRALCEALIARLARLPICHPEATSSRRRRTQASRAMPRALCAAIKRAFGSLPYLLATAPPTDTKKTSDDPARRGQPQPFRLSNNHPDKPKSKSTKIHLPTQHHSQNGTMWDGHSCPFSLGLMNMLPVAPIARMHKSVPPSATCVGIAVFLSN